MTLKELIDFMRETLTVRRTAAEYWLAGAVKPRAAKSLERAKSFLEALPREEDKVLLTLDGKEVPFSLEYEISELEKDIVFLNGGEQELYGYLESLHSGFSSEVAEGVEFLKGTRFKNLFSDRDGTVNNYCARYNTSVQSAYNAAFIAKYVKNRVENGVILTSAPLEGIGIIDLSAMPEYSVIFGGSKGREMADLKGERHRYPVEEDKQEKLDELNRNLQDLLDRNGYRKLRMIGSGLQFKFGQTTVARQDMNGSVDPKKSDDFLRDVENMVSELDPDHQVFRIEDTGKDIEILLTVEGGSRDFDKGDGIEFIDQTLGLGLLDGPNLICGDTHSDVPMVRASMARTENTRAVFVTKDEELKQEVRNVCESCLFLEEPDTLVTILNELGKKELSE
ncbi:MAG: trehalose 6-phosphate synthase [Spirochaetia bacterium]